MGYIFVLFYLWINYFDFFYLIFVIIGILFFFLLFVFFKIMLGFDVKVDVGEKRGKDGGV